MTPRPVLVDCDPALLTWGLDLDDDLALLFLLGSPEVDVVAVTTAYGNSSSTLCHRDARRLLALAGRGDIPVHRGAGWRSRDLRPTAASRAIVEAVSRHAGRLTVLALAPPTNVAAALASEPRLGDGIAELVLMGGRVEGDGREFNFSAHPAAARAVLHAGCPTVKLARELCQSVAVAPEELSRLAVRGALVSRFLPRIRRFARFQRRYRSARREPGEVLGGFHPWDVLAAAWLVAPGLFDGIVTLAPTVDDGGHVTTRGGGGRVRAPRRVDVAAFKELMAARLTAVPALGTR